MFAVTHDIRVLSDGLAAEVIAYRRKVPDKPYLVLVPGFTWAVGLQRHLASTLKDDGASLPRPGGEFLDLAEAALRCTDLLPPRTHDIYHAALETANTLGHNKPGP